MAWLSQNSRIISRVFCNMLESEGFLTQEFAPREKQCLIREKSRDLENIMIGIILWEEESSLSCFKIEIPSKLVLWISNKTNEIVGDVLTSRKSKAATPFLYQKTVIFFEEEDSRICFMRGACSMSLSTSKIL